MATILVVDDDRSVLGLVKRFLESDGHRVYAAECAAEAIGIAHSLECGYDLLVTDMVMPVTSGHDLILAVRRMCPTVGTMAMSGAFAPGDFRQRDYIILAKPFTREQLLATVKAILYGRGVGGGG